MFILMVCAIYFVLLFCTFQKDNDPLMNEEENNVKLHNYTPDHNKFSLKPRMYFSGNSKKYNEVYVQYNAYTEFFQIVQSYVEV